MLGPTGRVASSLHCFSQASWASSHSDYTLWWPSQLLSFHFMTVAGTPFFVLSLTQNLAKKAGQCRRLDWLRASCVKGCQMIPFFGWVPTRLLVAHILPGIAHAYCLGRCLNKSTGSRPVIWRYSPCSPSQSISHPRISLKSKQDKSNLVKARTLYSDVIWVMTFNVLHINIPPTYFFVLKPMATFH